MKNCSFTLKCGECDKVEISLSLCQNCSQILCRLCDQRIHNKGYRALHERINLSEHRLKIPSKSNHEIPYFSYELYQEKELSGKLKRIFSFLLENTKKGKPIQKVTEIFKMCSFHEKESFEELFEESGNHSIFVVTTRTFGDHPSFTYLSLKLEEISIESITWVIISLNEDKIQPTDSLVISRLKEFFGIKMSMKEWKGLLEGLSSMKEQNFQLNLYKNELGKLRLKTIREEEYLFSVDDTEMQCYEDISVVEPQDRDYQQLRDYMISFFNETDKNQGKDEQGKWFSSVENNQSGISTTDSALRKLFERDKIHRAIPGGRYGCALMLKHVGPESIRKLSLGRLLSLVGQALNDKFLVHFKTLIILNTKDEETDRKNKIEEIKDAQSKILALLKDLGKEGSTLAQLPLLINERLGRSFDFQAMGFSKLKTFLETLEPKIMLKKSGINHLLVSYNFDLDNQNEPNSNETSEKTQRFFDCTRINRPFRPNKFFTLKPNGLPKPFQPLIKGRDGQDHKKSFSNIQDYFTNISVMLLKVLEEYKYGIESDLLHQLLNKELKATFDPQIFNCKDFKDFLLLNFEDYLDIELKRDNREDDPEKKGYLCFFVFPKIYKSKPNTSSFLRKTCDKHREETSAMNHFACDHSCSCISRGESQLESSISRLSIDLRKDRNHSGIEEGEGGFEFALLSPVYSQSNTILGNERGREAGKEDSYSFDNKSLQFINYLIDEDEGD